MLQHELLGSGGRRDADLAAVLLGADALAGLGMLVLYPRTGVLGLCVLNLVVLLAAGAVWRGGRHLDPRRLRGAVIALFVSGFLARALLGPAVALGVRASLVFVWLGMTQGGRGVVLTAVLMVAALLGGGAVRDLATIGGVDIGLSGPAENPLLDVVLASVPTWLIVGFALAVCQRLHRGEAESLAHRATHDPLTGVANRDLLVRRLDAALQREDAERGEVTVLYVDLDDFKQVNDVHGHAVGDAVLAAIGGRLLSAVRPTDLVARVGGDEFVVLCDGTDTGEPEQLRERIERAVRCPIAAGSQIISVRASVGLHSTAEKAQPAHAVLAAADAAMYDRKRNGRTHV